MTPTSFLKETCYFYHNSSDSVNAVLPATAWNVDCDLLKQLPG